MAPYNHVYSHILTEGVCVTEVRISDAPPAGKLPHRVNALWTPATAASSISSVLVQELGLVILPIADPGFRLLRAFAPKASIPKGKVEVCLYLDDDDPLFVEFLVYDRILQYPALNLVLGLDFISRGTFEIRNNGDCPVLNFFYSIKE